MQETSVKPLFQDISILIIDDDLFLLKLVKKLLSNLGVIDITSATDGLEGIKKIQEQSFDIVITDLNMPKLDGVDLITKLAKIAGDTSIVIMSGEDPRVLSWVSNLANEHKITLLDIIKKPISPTHLSSLLTKHLEVQNKASDEDNNRPTIELSAAVIKKGIKDGAITVVFQPQIRLEDNVVIGFEALARWHHEDTGILGPSSFIPVAEANGLMNEVTDAILEACLTQVADFPTSMKKIKISVNIDVDNLNDNSFTDRVLEKCEEFDFDPKQLVLEVKETKIPTELQSAYAVLKRLKDVGVNLTIDDFGTSKESYENLYDLPFTELKISPEYVRNISKIGNSEIEALDDLIKLSKKLGLKSVAKGIETKDEVEILKTLNCDAMQGFYSARPLPNKLLEKWYEKREKK